MKKVVVFIVVLGLISAGAVFLLPRFQKRGEGERGRGGMDVPMVTAEIGDLDISVEATGPVTTNLDVEVKSKASGEVIRLPFNEGDTVKKGQLLMELDPSDEQRRVLTAEGNLAVSDAQLSRAMKDLVVAKQQIQDDKKRALSEISLAKVRAVDAASKAARTEELLKLELASTEEAETVRANAQEAALSLKRAELSLEEIQSNVKALVLKEQEIKQVKARRALENLSLADAKQRLKETKIYAPMNGTITVKNVQIGQIVSSGISNVGGGTSLMMLSDLSRLFVLASVDESDIAKIKKGMPVELSTDALGEKKFKGVVDRIAPRGKTVQNVVTFDVRVELLGPEKAMLKPEMTMAVKFLLQRKKGVVLVPLMAIQQNGPESFVLMPQKNENGENLSKSIRIGMTNGQDVEILSGLKEGDEIVLPIQGDQSESQWRQGGGQGGQRPQGQGGGGDRRNRMMPMGGGRR